jgi:phage terminase small subunit
MPALRPRAELFVQTFLKGAKQGVTARQAYIAAGYRSRGDAADACASRLLSSAKVKARIDELARPAVRKMQFSLENLSVELEKTIADARSKGQNSVVIRASS